jgi:hypothetical protein
MRPIRNARLIVVGALALGLAIMAGLQADKKSSSQRPGPHHAPGVLEVSAGEQFEWLDENLPKLLAAMAASPEARARVAGSLATANAPPAPLTPVSAGLAPGELERLSAIIHTAVAGNRRYGQSTKSKPKATVSVMPLMHTVRAEIKYPAPPASADLEPGPLTFDVWVCPDRETALALFWCRRGGSDVLSETPEGIKKTLLDRRLFHAAPEIAADQKPPGESASWLLPRMVISVLLEKGHKPMPEDHLSFIRGNVVVEASTVEYTRWRGGKEWLAGMLKECAPDVVAVERAIDNGLVEISRREAPGRATATATSAKVASVDSVPRPGLMQVAPLEQSSWLDEKIPRVVAAMNASPEVRAAIHGPLATAKAASSSVAMGPAGLAPGELERLSTLIHAAVAGETRYRQSATTQVQPNVTVMPRTQIARVEMTYPAPPASKILKPGPLTIDVWTCHDRETALALFWLRKGGTWLLDIGSEDLLKQSILSKASPIAAPALTADAATLGESAYSLNPRLALPILLMEGAKPMPADRVSFVRGNVVIEASTVEFTRRHGEKEWLAWTLRYCAPDVVAVLSAIDKSLLQTGRPAEPGRAPAIAANSEFDPRRSSMPGLVTTRSMALEQSDWLDKSIQPVMDAMTTISEAGARIASPLLLDGRAPPSNPLTPQIDGLAAADLERLSELVYASVTANRQFAAGARGRPPATVTVLPATRIVRFEVTYPAPPVANDSTPGPLTIDVWVCPHRGMSLALFWLRKGADHFLDTRSKDGSNYAVLDPTYPVKRSVLDPRFHLTATELAEDANPPGESAYQFNPRLPFSLTPSQEPEPMPADRMTYLRGNIVVEASTVEHVRRPGKSNWVPTDLNACASDVTAVLHKIDAGLVRFARDVEPGGN